MSRFADQRVAGPGRECINPVVHPRVCPARRRERGRRRVRYPIESVPLAGPRRRLLRSRHAGRTRDVRAEGPKGRPLSPMSVLPFIPGNQPGTTARPLLSTSGLLRSSDSWQAMIRRVDSGATPGGRHPEIGGFFGFQPLRLVVGGKTTAVHPFATPDPAAQASDRHGSVTVTASPGIPLVGGPRLWDADRSARWRAPVCIRLRGQRT